MESESTPSSAPAGTPLRSLGLPDLFSAKGLVVLITGGGTGIGLVMARALAEAGAARVYICGRRRAVLEEAAATVAATAPGVLVPLEVDVRSKASLAAAAAAVAADETVTGGGLDVLVCNAGVNGPKTADPVPGVAGLAQWCAQQLAVDEEAYVDTFRVNAASVWYTAMTFLPLLDAGNRRRAARDPAGAATGAASSQIVVTSSVAGFYRTATGTWAYGQSKAATTLLAKQLATLLLPNWGIRVNCLCPGYFPSQMTSTLMDSLGGTAQPLIPIDTERVPLGRIGDERDMAGTILYLVSRAGAYLNGNMVIIDGGRLGIFPATY